MQMRRPKPLPCTTRWISFKDKLPPDNFRVLIKSDTLAPIRVRRRGDNYTIGGVKIDMSLYTHWEK